MDGTGKIETCTSTFDADPSEQGKSYFDVFRRVDPDVVETYYFERIEDARTFALTGVNLGNSDRQHFYRCLDYEAARMAPYLSTDHSALSTDDRLKLIAPDLDKATVDIMTRVLETIRADHAK